jgi:hypothetical protein
MSSPPIYPQLRLKLTMPTALKVQFIPAIPGVNSSNKVDRSGDTMTGPLILYADPVQPLEAVTKHYVDAIGGGLPASAAPFYPVIQPSSTNVQGSGIPVRHQLVWSDTNPIFWADTAQIISTDPTATTGIHITGTPANGTLTFTFKWASTTVVVPVPVTAGQTISQVTTNIGNAFKANPQLFTPPSTFNIAGGGYDSGAKFGWIEVVPPADIALNWDFRVPMTEAYTPGTSGITIAFDGNSTPATDIAAAQALDNNPAIQLIRNPGAAPTPGSILGTFHFTGSQSSNPTAVTQIYGIWGVRVGNSTTGAIDSFFYVERPGPSGGIQFGTYFRQGVYTAGAPQDHGADTYTGKSMVFLGAASAPTPGVGYLKIYAKNVAGALHAFQIDAVGTEIDLAAGGGGGGISGTGTDKHLVRWSGTSAVQDSRITVDDAGNVIANLNSGAPVALGSSAGGMQIVGPDAGNTNTTVGIDAYSGGAPIFLGRASQGPQAAKTAVVQPEILMAAQGQGWDGSAYAAGGGFQIRVGGAASAAWTSTLHPSQAAIRVVPNTASAVPYDAVLVDGSGAVALTSPNGTILLTAAFNSWTWWWPIGAGTAGQVLTSGGGTAAMTWATPSAGTGGLTTNAMFRNMVGRNGGLEIWQRGASIAVPASSPTFYTADGFYMITGANQACTASRQAGLNVNSRYCGRFQRNSGQIGTTPIGLGFPLDTNELIRMRGKRVILFFTYSTGTNWSAGSLGWNLIFGQGAVPTKRGFGSYVGETIPLTGSVVATPATGATQVFSAVSSVIDSAATQCDLVLVWTPTGSAGANDWVQIDDLQVMEVPAGFTDTASLTFERAPILADYQRCAAFYEKSYAIDEAPGTPNTPLPFFPIIATTIPNSWVGQVQFNIRKRANPTVTVYSYNGTPATFSQGGSPWNNYPVGTGVAGSVTDTGANLFQAGGTIIILNNAISGHWVADASI